MSDQEEILEEIRQVVEKTPVLLFMKGTPSFPQCGFSARVVQVLESYGIPFKTVDVLANPLVREGVKQFANWPTVPQLYANGKFVGGCDIVVEMHEEGELESVLREAAPATEPA